MWWMVNAKLRPLYPLKTDPVQGTGWDRSGRVRKISPPLGVDPRTVQHVASRYTDYANPAHFSLKTDENSLTLLSV